jgi:hypothetical protein
MGLEENLVLILLEASITGAGLVLAIYALIIPLYRRIFGYRTRDIQKDLQELKEEIGKTKTSVSQGKVDDLTNKLTHIKELGSFPKYLDWIAEASFFLYSASALMSLWWILGWNKNAFDVSLPYAFGIATILFIVIGVLAIKDISGTMKREFQDAKSEAEG